MHRDFNLIEAKPQPPQQLNIGGVITGFWALRKQLDRLPGLPVVDRDRVKRCCFLRLLANMVLERQHRDLRRAARQRKRSRVIGILQEAESAAIQGNTRRVYQFVRQLSPKGVYRKIRFRDAQGGVMSREQECTWMIDYATKLFTGREFVLPPLEPLPAHYFDDQSWVDALHALKTHKAVPWFSASVGGWKHKAKDVAPLLGQFAKEALCCANPRVPTAWGQVQLAWLAKAHKSPSCPQNLRTIGLMSPDTKAFLIILKRQAEPFILDSMTEVPQYAYRAGASTADAILRGGSHCRRIRQVLQKEAVDHTAKVLHQARAQLVGGLMCGLDLSQAFDRLEYSEMFSALIDTGMPSALAKVLISVHAQTTLHIRHGASQGTASMTRGLRQGCPIAPMIYTAWVVRFCKLVDQRVREHWTLQHMSIFADDKHCFWEITNPHSLRQAIAQLRIVLDVLRGCGMEVSVAKCVAVLALRGSWAKQAMQKHTKYWNGRKSLHVPGTQGSDYIPIEEHMTYLGIQLSYGAFELLTVQMRASKAEQSFAGLRQVLRTRGPLSLRQRQRIYNACVLPSLLYGLTAVGITPQVLQKIHSVQAQHMRKLHRVHEHGVTNLRVLAQAGLCPRSQTLTRAQQQLRLIQQDGGRSERLKAMELQQARVIHSEVELLTQDERSTSLVPVNSQHIEAVTCPVCGIDFDGPPSLHKHIHAKHPELNISSRIKFNRAEHSLFGLPFCRFCRVRCGDWHALEKHATQGMCLRLKQGFAANRALQEILAEVQAEERLDPPVPPAEHVRHDSVLAAFSDHAVFKVPLHEVPSHAEYICTLGSVCALCGQRMQQASRIKSHWQRQHGQAWALVQTDAASTARSLISVFRSPCQFCHSTAKNPKQHADKCSAFFQVAAVRHLLQLGRLDMSLVGSKAPALRPFETQPAYKSFTLGGTPLGRAFAGSRPSTTGSSDSGLFVVGTSTGLKLPSHGHAGGKVPSMFKRTTQRVPDQALAREPPAQAPWTCRLKLQNPRALCYMNATLIALLHGLVLHRHPWSNLQFLQQLCQRAAERSQPLLLSSLPRFAHLCRRWGFHDRQEDAAEFLLNVLLPAGQFNTLWERRSLTSDGPRMLDQGELPITLRLPDSATDLQTVINQWCLHGNSNALAYSDGLIVLQLLRFRQGRKLQIPVRLPATVLLPAFAEGISTVWQPFQLVAFVVHEGQSLHRGHYRAMLRVGVSWVYQDDNSLAMPSPVTDAHHKNVE